MWPRLNNSLPKYQSLSKVLKLKNSNLSWTNFWSSFLMSQNCPTISLHQEAIASSTSSLIWGLKEFTEVVESPTRPWNSLSCFETSPSIQVSIKVLQDLWLIIILNNFAYIILIEWINIKHHCGLRDNYFYIFLYPFQ